jgi:transcriptional regulator with XRE-family HTH domain
MKGNGTSIQQLIGTRLTQLRGELAGPGEKRWSQSRVAVETGLTQNIVTKLEKSSTGLIGSLLALLLFYHAQDYNITWILLPNNAAVSKRRLADHAKAVELQVVVMQLNGLKNGILTKMDDLPKALRTQ